MIRQSPSLHYHAHARESMMFVYDLLQGCSDRLEEGQLMTVVFDGLLAAYHRCVARGGGGGLTFW